MAKQRINPEVQTDRVFQPTAQPVDLYYRPNLSAVELSRTGQIIDALKAFSPQLERFTSDIVAMNIATEKRVGAMEAMSGTVEAASAKAAKAIEGAGGVNPWRYEAFLDTMGRRMVREKYQAALYQNIDDLSALTNPDGTLRSGDYVTQKMTEFFTDVGVPQGSYFAARAAMDEKTKIDAQFLPMVQARHAEKLKAQNMQDLKDEMFGILDSQSTLHLADDGREAQTFQAQMRSVMEKMRSLDGTSGAELYSDALIEWAKAKADEGDHEAARLALESSRKGEKFVVNGIELGAVHAAKLNSAIDAIDDKRIIDENRLLANRERNLETAARRAAASARQQAFDAVREGMAAGKLPSFALTPGQKQAMVEGFWEAHSKDIHPDDKDRFTSELHTTIDQVVASANAPVTDNPNTVRLLMEDRRRGIDPAVYERIVMDAAGRGELNLDTAMKMIDGYSQYQHIISRGNLGDASVSLGQLFGTDDEKNIAPAMQQSVRSARVQLSGEILDEVQEIFNKDIVNLPPEQQGAAIRAAFQKVSGERIAKFKAENKDMLDSADLRKSQEVFSEGTAKVREAMIKEMMVEFAAEDLPLGQRNAIESYLDSRLSVALAEEHQRIMEEDGVDPRQAYSRLSSRYRAISSQVLDETINNSNKRFPVPLKIQEMIRRQTAVDLGQAPASAASKTAGLDPRLAELTTELEAMQVVRSLPETGPIESFLPTTWARSFGEWLSQDKLVENLDTFQKRMDLAARQSRAKDPAAAKTLDEARGILQDTANSSVQRMFQIGSYVSSIPGVRGAVPLYKAQNGAVSVYDQTSRSYQFSEQATENYWRLKGLTGVSPEELREGVTTEGLAVDFARLDPTRHLIGRSAQEQAALIDEYNASIKEGQAERGVYADWMRARLDANLPVPSPDDILRSQAILLRQYVPSAQRGFATETKANNQ